MEYADDDTDSGGLFEAGDSLEDVKHVLEQSEEAKRRRLERELERVEAQLARRTELYEDAVETLEARINRYVNEVKQTYSRPFGGNQEQREELQEHIGELYRELRREKRQHWQDRQSLEQERREILQRLEALEEGDSVFDVL